MGMIGFPPPLLHNGRLDDVCVCERGGVKNGFSNNDFAVDYFYFLFE